MTYEKAKSKGEVWLNKIRASNRKFEEWERKFKCKTLEKYYEGFQWRDADPNYEYYVLNLIFSTFNIKRPTLIFKDPIFYVDPKPSASNFNSDQAYNYCQNATDLLNTIIGDRTVNLGHELEMAVIDAGPYFGVIEVGYDARWIKNPNAGYPVQSEDEENLTTESEIVREPEMIPEEEWIYTKRIPSHRFRVSTVSCSSLDKAEWYGYYEFVRAVDLKDPQLKFQHIKELNLDETSSNEYSGLIGDEGDDDKAAAGFSKIWKIWDNRAKQFYIITDAEGVVIYTEPFERRCIFDLRFHKRRKGWLPIPWFFNWKSPQDEINESREQIRAARRRTKRAYQAVEGQVDEEEIQKFVTGPDGVVVNVKRDNAIQPIVNPPVDSVIGAVLQVSKDDFNIASATSSEMRGQADNTTATQAKITESRSQQRDTDEREVVAKWICDIGLEILEQARRHLTLPMWVKTQLDLGSVREMGPLAGWAAEIPDLQSSFRMLRPDEDLGDISYKVNITVESLSPVANDQLKTSFLEFVAIMQQYPILGLHPGLIQEAAYRLGYRNIQIIRYFQQAAMMQMVGQMAGAIPSGEGNTAQRTTEQMMPPTQGALENQLAAQGVPGAS